MALQSTKQTYKYVQNNSILNGCSDEYQLSKNEFYTLYSFYVVHSMCVGQSGKRMDFIGYGWPGNKLEGALLVSLNNVIDFNKNPNFVFTDKNDLKERFSELNLMDGYLADVDWERFVIAKTKENNRYLKMFYRVRDGLAHGRYTLRFSSSHEKMIVIQDNDQHNVTARMVVRLNTLLSFVSVIDKNHMFV